MPRTSSPNPFAAPFARSQAPGGSNVRVGILLLLVAMAVLLYLDRFCLGAVSPIMIRELGVTKEEFGRAVGAFFFVYALLQVPAGQLCDYLGTRWTLAVFVLGWS